MAETPKSKPRPKRRRWLRRSLYALLGTVTLLFALVIALLHSSTLTQWVLQWAVDRYDEAIPGSIVIGSIDGALASDLVLTDVRCDDALGRAVVTAGELRVGVDVPALLAGTLDLGRLRAIDLLVFVPDDGAGGFADLAPPSEGEPPPAEPDEGLGPDLPLPIVAGLDLERCSLAVGSDPRSATTIVRLDRASVDVEAEGRTAALVLALAGGVEPAGLEVGALELRAGWSEPVVTVESVVLASNLAELEFGPARLDLAAWGGNVERLHAVIAREALPPAIATTGSTVVDLDLDGSPLGFAGGLELEAPGVLEASLGVHGAMEPELGLALDLDATVLAGPRPMHASLRATAWERRPGDYAVDASLTCFDCELEQNAVTLDVFARARPEHDTAAAQLELRGAGTGLSVEAGLTRAGGLAVAGTLDVASLARLRELALPFVELPPLRGVIASSFGCRGELDPLDPLDMRCDARARLDQGHPLQRAIADVSVETGSSLAIEARQLGLAAVGAEVELASPTKISVREGRVDIDGLELHVATGSGRGIVAAHGVFDPAGAHDLHAELRAVDLAAIGALVPNVRSGGRVDATIDLQGTSASPRFQATLSGRGLSWQGRSIGSLALDARAEHQRASANMRLRGPAIDSLDVRAAMPLTVRLDGGPMGTDGGSLSGSVRLRGAHLERLAALAGASVRVRGRADLDVRVAGSLDRPRVSTELQVRDAVVAGEALPDADLRAELDRRTVRAELDLRDAAFDEARLEVDVPVLVDLERRRFAWRSADEHRVAFRLARLDLDAVASRQPGLPLDGEVDVGLDVRGSMLAPIVELALAARGLAWNGQAIADAELRVDYGDQRIRAAASARGPSVGGVGLAAEVPVRLVPAEGAAQWLPAEAHALDVYATGVRLDRLPIPLDLRGQAELRATIEGNAHHPRAALDLAVDRLAYGEHAVGDLTLATRYEDERGRADLRLVHDPSRTVSVAVEVPFLVDLAAGVFAWEDDGAHRLSIQAPKLDRVLLEPFVDLPEDAIVELSLRAEGRGHLDAFTARVGVDGRIGLTGRGIQPLSLIGKADPTRQSLAVRLGSAADPLLEVDSSLAIPLPAAVRGTGSIDGSALRVRATADGVQLSTFDGAARGVLHGLRGQLGLSAAIDGTIAAPTLDGRLSIRDGAVTVVPLRQRFEDIELRVGLARNSISIEELALRSGAGSIESSGRVDLGDETRATFDIDIESLPLRRPGLPRMDITTKIAAGLQLGPDGTAVDVRLADSHVDVALSSVAAPKAIPQSERVHYVALTGAQAVDPLREAVPSEPVPARQVVVDEPSRFDFALALADPLRIRGPAVDMSWGGNVGARVRGSSVAVRGALTASDGQFDLLGNRFDIDTGTVTLPRAGGDLIPFIEVVAKTRVGDVIITARVHGRATEPELDLSSDPPLTQSQIFTMLVTGSADLESADPEQVQAQAASLLAALSNPALQRELNERLRIDRIGVAFGETTEQPILAVGKNVTKKLYAETQYHHNAPPTKNRAQLKVRYRLAPRWSLETFFGDAAAGGVDVFWGKSFDPVDRRRTSETREATQTP